MPIPFIIYLVGAAAVWTISAVTYDRNRFTLSILGRKGTGKTTLTCHLRGIDYSGGTSLRGVKACTYHANNNKSLKLYDGVDISGSPNYFELWERRVKNDDIIIYIINAHEILKNNEEYINLVEIDINNILEWRKQRNVIETKSIKKFLVIISFTDLLSDGVIPQIEEKITDKIPNLKFKQNLTVLVGSQINEENMKKLGCEIVDFVYDNNNF